MRRISVSVGTASLVGLAVGMFSLTAPKAWAIDGPSVNTIPNADWGGAGDIWPHVVRVEIDTDGDGTFNDFKCSGTLIAPDVVATAGHCFGAGSLELGDNSNIDADRVRINFGPGASTQSNPSPPKPPTPARLESNFLSVSCVLRGDACSMNNLLVKGLSQASGLRVSSVPAIPPRIIFTVTQLFRTIRPASL